MRRECFRARDDDAGAIRLGCAGFAECADGLEAALGIPVLDGVVCATRMAESIVEIGRKTSRYKTCRFPERKAFTGMMRHFGTPAPIGEAAAE